MTVNDFEPTEYRSRDGSIRARKDGVLWYGEELRGGRWKRRALGCTNYITAISVTLVMLGLDEPEDYRREERDEDAF